MPRFNGSQYRAQSFEYIPKLQTGSQLGQLNRLGGKLSGRRSQETVIGFPSHEIHIMIRQQHTQRRNLGMVMSTVVGELSLHDQKFLRVPASVIAHTLVKPSSRDNLKVMSVD